MLRVGLTGGIGSGKSEVSRRLAERGAVVIDADLLARDALAGGSQGLAEVVAAFGSDVVDSGGELDRAALGRLVFADADARRRLEAIVHPLVRARADEIESAAVRDRPDVVVVHDIALLVETEQADHFDVVVVVDAPEDLQVDRLVRLRGMEPTDATARIGAQATRPRRVRAADEVVDNAGDMAALDAQVAALWSRLESRAAAG